MGTFNNSTGLFSQVNWPSSTNTTLNKQALSQQGLTSGQITNLLNGQTTVSQPSAQTNAQQTTQQNTTQQVSSPVSVQNSNTPLANGLTVVATYTASNGKSLTKCTTAGGHTVWVNGPIDPASFPSNLVADMNASGKTTVVGQATGIGINAINGLILPSGLNNSTNGHNLVLAGPNNNGQWYKYTRSNNSYVTPSHALSPAGNTAWGSTSVPPLGLGYVYNIQKGNTLTFNGSTISQTFNTLAEAQAYVAQHGGNITTNHETYPNGPIMPSQYTTALQNDGWTISNTTHVPFLSSITDASQYQNNPDYKVTSLGISGGTSGNNWDDIDQDTLNNLIQQYKGNPNFSYTQDGYYPGQTLKKTGVVVGSQEYQDLIKAGYKEIKTYPGNGTTHTVELGKGLTEAEAIALLANNPDATKMLDGGSKTITTSKTVSLKGLTADQLAQYQNNPNYKVVKEYDVSNGSHTSTKYYNNPVVGAMFEVMNSADNDGVLTSAELNSIFSDPKYRVNSLDDEGTLADGTTTITDNKNCDDQNGYLAGDPGIGTNENNYQWTDVDPGNNKNIVIAKNTSDGHFGFQLNGKTADINGDDASGTSFTEYQYNLTTSDGKKTKVNFNDGLVTITSDAGTANESTQVLDPTVSGDLPWQLTDPQSGKPVFKLEIKDIAGAGENGASEKRVVATAVSLPEKSVIDQLLADGVTLQEIYDKAGTVETSFGARAITAEGASAFGHSLGGAGLKDSLYNGIEDVYYDIHIGEKECVGFTQTIEDCDKMYDIEYTEDCDEEVPTYKVVKEVCTDETLADLCKEEQGDPKFDATLKGEEGCEKFKVDKVLIDLERNQYVVDCNDSITGSCNNASGVSPLALDLDGNGVTTTNTPWNFDIDGDGIMNTLNASLDSNDGWLAVDYNNDGIVNDGTELFGNYTNGQSFADGLEALRFFAEQNLVGSTADGVLDVNEIGILSSQYNLRVAITDANGNQQLVDPLSLNISQIKVYADPNMPAFTDPNGVYHNPRTTFTMNGVEQHLNDLWFYDVTGTLPSQQTATSANTTNTTTPNTGTSGSGVSSPGVSTSTGSSGTSSASSNAPLNNQSQINAAIQQALAQQFGMGAAQPQFAPSSPSQFAPVNPMQYMMPFMGGGFGAQFQQYLFIMLMSQMFSGGGFNPLWQWPQGTVQGNQPANNR